jgi:HAD superfamily hydrolase (TIGR01509 family)
MPEKPAIVFDLGNVLLSFDYSRAVRNLVGQCRISERELHALIDQSPLLLKYEAGALTTAEFFDQVKAGSSFCGELADFRTIFGDIFHEIPEMIALSTRLRAAGHPIYIFSNTNELAINFIRSRFPFFAGFDGYVLSYEQCRMKPDPKIYEVVEKTTGKKEKAIIYIDDREENVVAGAARGWNVVHHKDSGATISALKQLVNL